MTINRNNFEAYLLDYLEGNLNPLLTADLMAFLAENPEFEKYIPDYDSSLSLSAMQPYPQKNQLKKELSDLREQVRNCLKETRKIIFDLRPMTLDDLGLVPTMKRFLDTVKERNGIISEIRVLGEERRLDSYVEIGVFRIFQEAITNIEKHAKASAIALVVEFRRDMLLATIEDNGKGFNTENGAGSENFGLLGMRERVNLLNGEMTIKSEIGVGTKITVKVNLK